MDLSVWIDTLQGDLAADLLAFLPELIVCLGIIVFLSLRLFTAFNRLHLSSMALGFTLLALLASLEQWVQASSSLEGLDFSRLASLEYWLKYKKAAEMFGGLLAYDTFTISMRIFLLAFTALVIWLSVLTGIPDREDSSDFYTLLFGAVVGMSLMASANHLLMVFIGVEMASLPSYALAGFLKGKRQSSEASLKYVVYGGGASGVMLYGISLLVGKFGTGYLPDLAEQFHASLSSGFDPILVLAMLFILIGIGFKLAAVPFHFWCPDVFEGAAAEVAAFLSVASKGAALALLARFVFGLAGLTGVMEYEKFLASDHYLKAAQFFVPALAAFAAITATFGNLAAYLQTNLKRLLAYSTIAQAGYMMMGLAAMTKAGAGAVLFYLVAYLFMNLGAFAIVAFLRNQTGSEDLSSFKGLVQRSPVMVVTLGVFLFSLVGLPPLAGFAAKFQIFRVLFDSGQAFAVRAPNLSYTMYALLLIGGLNTVISLVYYIKVLKVMILDRADEEQADLAAAAPLAVPRASSFYAVLMAAAVLVLGILWDPLAKLSDKGVRFKEVDIPVAGSRGGGGP